MKSAAIEQIHAAYSFGATRWQVMRHVILPSAMPEILTAMRIGIGFGWTTLVAAEMVAATKGLGYMVLSASQFLQTLGRDHGHLRDRHHRLCLRPSDALRRTPARALEGPNVTGKSNDHDLPEESRPNRRDRANGMCALAVEAMLARDRSAEAKQPRAGLPRDLDNWEGEIVVSRRGAQGGRGLVSRKS